MVEILNLDIPQKCILLRKERSRWEGVRRVGNF